MPLRPLSIAFVSPFFPLKGGIARFSSALHAVLLKRGHKVEAISFKRLYPRLLFRGKTVYEQGVSCKPGNEVFPLLDTLNPLSWVAVARGLRRRKPDVILCAYWFGLFAPLYALIKQVSGRKMIVLMHNFASHETFAGETMLRNLMVASADGIVTLSQHVAHEVRKSYPHVPVRALFHPVYEPVCKMVPKEEARRKLGLGSSEPVLLFFGYVRKYKGLDILIESMPEVIRRHPGTQLLVAGEFYYGEKMFRERIDTLGIGEQVKVYAEFVSNDRMSLFFSAADVVVLPYREASQSGVVQQAYGFVRPVLVSGTGGLPEAVLDGETGAVVRALDPSAFAEGICDFLNSMKSVCYEEKVREYAKELSWEVFADKIGAFAGEVAG